MCYYITATLPKGTLLGDLSEVLEEFQMAFVPIQNDKVETQLRSGDLYFRATKNHCDCDTRIGSLNRQKDYQTLLNSKKVKTLRKKKWTEEEINNWINQKLEKKPKEIGRNLSPIEKENEIERWINFLLKILKHPGITRVGILKHWYQKRLKDEDINLKEIKRIECSKINPDLLLNIEEDILYEFFIPQVHN